MNGSEREGVSSVSKRVIGATIIGWLFLVLAVAISVLVFYVFTLPMEVAPWVVGTLTYLAAFWTGFLSAKRAPKKGFVNGFWGGVLFVAVYLGVNLITGTAFRILNGLVLLILSMVGGIFGINMKTKRRR